MTLIEQQHALTKHVVPRSYFASRKTNAKSVALQVPRRSAAKTSLGLQPSSVVEKTKPAADFEGFSSTWQKSGQFPDPKAGLWKGF